MQPNPPGFDPNEVIAGIHLAMDFGAPNQPGDRATFCWSTTTAAAGADEDGVPFDPSQRPTKTKHSETVSCAVDYSDGADRTERFGTLQPSRIEVTLLDPDYQKVKDFEFVVWGGDKYVRRSTQPYALGSLDVWVVQCRAEDES